MRSRCNCQIIRYDNWGEIKYSDDDFSYRVTYDLYSELVDDYCVDIYDRFHIPIAHFRYDVFVKMASWFLYESEKGFIKEFCGEDFDVAVQYEHERQQFKMIHNNKDTFAGRQLIEGFMSYLLEIFPNLISEHRQKVKSENELVNLLEQTKLCSI